MLELSYNMAAHVITHTHIYMHKHINYPDSKPHQFNLDLFKVHTLTLSFFSLRLVLSHPPCSAVSQHQRCDPRLCGSKPEMTSPTPPTSLHFLKQSRVQTQIYNYSLNLYAARGSIDLGFGARPASQTRAPSLGRKGQGGWRLVSLWNPHWEPRSWFHQPHAVVTCSEKSTDAIYSSAFVEPRILIITLNIMSCNLFAIQCPCNHPVWTDIYSYIWGEGCLKTGIKASTKHDCNYTLSLVSGISNENSL